MYNRNRVCSSIETLSLNASDSIRTWRKQKYYNYYITDLFGSLTTVFDFIENTPFSLYRLLNESFREM